MSISEEEKKEEEKLDDSARSKLINVDQISPKLQRKDTYKSLVESNQLLR